MSQLHWNGFDFSDDDLRWTLIIGDEDWGLGSRIYIGNGDWYLRYSIALGLVIGY